MRDDAHVVDEDDDRPTGEYRRPVTLTRPTEPPTVLSVDELATLLRVNRKTAYEAVARGLIPGVKRIGRAIRIDRVAVVNWLQGRSGVSRKSNGGSR
jgi:excisionase family DNA binding protein